MSTTLKIRFAGEHCGFVDFDHGAQTKLAERTTMSPDVVPVMRSAFARLGGALESIRHVNDRKGTPNVAINRCPNRASAGAGLDILIRMDRESEIDLAGVFGHSGFVQDPDVPETSMRISGVDYRAIPVAYTR